MRFDINCLAGVTHAWCHIALAIFVNLLPCPLREHEVKVLMAQGAIHRGLISAGMEIVHRGVGSGLNLLLVVEAPKSFAARGGTRLDCTCGS